MNDNFQLQLSNVTYCVIVWVQNFVTKLLNELVNCKCEISITSTIEFIGTEKRRILIDLKADNDLLQRTAVRRLPLDQQKMDGSPRCIKHSGFNATTAALH
jgi:hypothetical protein